MKFWIVKMIIKFTSTDNILNRISVQHEHYDSESNGSPGPVLSCHRASKGKQASYHINVTEKYPLKDANIYTYMYTEIRTRAEK